MTLPWLRPTWLQLISSAQQRRLGHAIGLPWLPALGTDKLAEHLSQWLLCQAPDKGSKACGQCKSCLLLKAQHHPDFLTLGEDSESSIGVDSIRQLQQRLSNTAHQGGHKVVLLANAHTMTVAAANALLKTLEEPPRDSTILLASNRWDALLPTVRSRLQHYQVHAPSVETLAQWLTQHAQTPVQPSESLRLWCQRPLDALDALRQGQDFSASPLESVLRLQPLAKSTSQPAEVIALLNEFETLLRDALWLSMQGAVQQGRSPQLIEAAALQRALSFELITLTDIERALADCQQVRQHLRGAKGLNPQLALQRVVTPFLAKLQQTATTQRQKEH